MVVGLSPYHYVDDSWQAPGAGIDLRPLPDQSLAGAYADHPYGLFILPGDSKPNSDFIRLGEGNPAEIIPSDRQRNTWEALIGYRPRGLTVADWLFDTLTLGADPAGLDRPCPLLPNTAGYLVLYFGSLRLTAKHRWGDVYTDRIAARLHLDYLAAEKTSLEHARKVLDYNAIKYRLTKGDDYLALLPPEKRADYPGRLAHDTTITDDFTRADGTTIGNALTWTETINDLATVSNAVRNNGAGASNYARARAESDLSGADHYAQAALSLGANTARGCGVHARYDSAADTCYGLHYMGGGAGVTKIPAIDKHVTGTRTVLATGSATDYTNGDIGKLEVSGSTLTGYRNGGSVVTVTDSSISGGTRCGIFVRARDSADAVVVDTFEAADLAVAAGQPTMRRWGGVPHLRQRPVFGRSW